MLPKVPSASKSPAASSNPLDLVVGEAIQLPSFPDLLLRLDKELKNDEVNFGRISGLVRMDPVISGQILRLANSTWYSRGGQPVQDLSRAMIRLGLPLTKELVQALVMPSLFGKGGGVLDHGAYWRHSLSVALHAQSIGRMLNLPKEQMELLWMAGILHDIGAILCDIIAPEKLRMFFAVAHGAKDGELDLADLEMKWLGVEHATLGATFLHRTWHLPEDIVEVVGGHEHPMELPAQSKTFRPALCIHVADLLCEGHGAIWLPCRERGVEQLDPALEILGLGPDTLLEMADEVEQIVKHADSLLASSES